MAAKKKITKPAPKKKPTAKKPAPKKGAGKVAAKKPAAKKAAAAKKPAGKKAPARGKQRVAKRPPLRAKSKATKARAPRAPKPPVAPAPEALALARAIAGVASEKKAADVVILDTRARASAVGYDYVVLASGDSDRQLAAIHEGVDELLKPQGKRAGSVEASPDWVCVTYDEGVVAHFFTPDRREQMDLEGLWHAAPRVTA